MSWSEELIMSKISLFWMLPLCADIDSLIHFIFIRTWVGFSIGIQTRRQRHTVTDMGHRGTQRNAERENNKD